MDLLEMHQNLKMDLESLEYDAKLYFCTYVDLGLECHCADKKYECLETLWEDAEGHEFVESEISMLCFNCIQRPEASPTIGLQVTIDDCQYDFFIGADGRVQPRSTRGHFFSGPIEQWAFKNRPRTKDPQK